MCFVELVVSAFFLLEMEDLSKLAAEVLELVRNEIGDEQYANALLKCQTEALAKSQQRKRSLKVCALTHHNSFVLRKIMFTIVYEFIWKAL